MSFIDLMSNDIWTEADILRRTESMIRSEFSLESESVLNRKATGAALGNYTLSEDEMYELVHYTAVAENVRIEYQAALEDMKLLNAVFPYEKAEAFLAKPSLLDAINFQSTTAPEPIVDVQTEEVTNQDEIDAYQRELELSIAIITSHGINLDNYLIEGEEPSLDINRVITENQTAIDADNAERQQAQSLIDQSSDEVKQLAELRKTRI